MKLPKIYQSMRPRRFALILMKVCLRRMCRLSILNFVVSMGWTRQLGLLKWKPNEVEIIDKNLSLTKFSMKSLFVENSKTIFRRHWRICSLTYYVDLS